MSEAGRDTEGWWVRLERDQESDEVVGPYADETECIEAMNDSLLIQGFLEEDEHVVLEVTAWYGKPQDVDDVTIIDRNEPGHFGRKGWLT